MNTKIYLWIIPTVIRNKKAKAYDKIHFNVIIKGEHFDKELSEIDDMLSGKIMQEIMDFADIVSNYNYGVDSATETNDDTRYCETIGDVISITFEKSPQEIEHDIKMSDFLNSVEPIVLDRTNIIAKDDGTIDIVVKDLDISQNINTLELWDIFNRNIIGKIQEGDKIELTDDNGNKIFDLLGGSFLNVAIADIGIYNKSQDNDLKGGIFIRENGRLDVGDFKRTFYIEIHTNNLLKACLKANKTINEFTNSKFLESINNK